tara:strand:- start:308 stop:553 length:246 start_codon:yes stop_codon:yes gene_type:complete
MKVRMTFNDGKNFSHYAFVVFKAGFVTTYLCSGLFMFGSYFMNASEHMKEVGPEILQEMQQFYFSVEEENYMDCENCDEID